MDKNKCDILEDVLCLTSSSGKFRKEYMQIHESRLIGNNMPTFREADISVKKKHDKKPPIKVPWSCDKS